MEGLVKLGADLRDVHGKLHSWFQREQSPEGTLDDAGLWTVLKEAETEFGVELEPLVTELTAKQASDSSGKRLKLTYVDLGQVLKEYIGKQVKEGYGKQDKKAKPGKKTSENPAPAQEPASETASQADKPASPKPQGSKSSQELILEARLKEKNLTDWMPTASPARPVKSTRGHPTVQPAGKTAEGILATWQSQQDEIRTLYNTEGPMKTLEALAGQSDLEWSSDLASLFQELMGKRTDDCGEDGDVYNMVFWPAVEEWVGANPRVQATFKQNPTEQLIEKLRKTIREVEEIGKAQDLSGQDSSSSHQLIQTLRSQLRALESPQKSGEDAVFQQKCKSSIHEIYVFYAKQTKMIGTKPSFDDILHSISVLNSGKFFKFLRDFQLLENSKISTRKVIDKATAMNIFKKTALFQKEMNEAQFTMALDLVAMSYFDSEFDRLNRTDLARLSMSEKRERLYRTLGLDQEAKYREKMKGYGIPFSSYTDYRIPPDDPARRYKYKEYKHQRMTLEQWKERMRGPMNSSITTAQPIPEERSASMPKQSSIKASGKGSGKGKKETMGSHRKLDSSDFDLDDLIGNSGSESSESPSPKNYGLTKSTSSIFHSPPARPPKESSRVDSLMKASLSQENLAMARALKATNAQLEKGQKVALRMEAAASKYNA